MCGGADGVPTAEQNFDPLQVITVLASLRSDTNVDIVIDKDGNPRKPTTTELAEVEFLRKRTNSTCRRHVFEYNARELRECETAVYVMIDKDGNPQEYKLGQRRPWEPTTLEEGWIKSHWERTGCPCHVFEDRTSIVILPDYDCQECHRDIKTTGGKS